jgi:hypothetical protein
VSACLRHVGAWLLRLASRIERGAVQPGTHPDSPDLRVQERLFELRTRIHTGYY